MMPASRKRKQSYGTKAYVKSSRPNVTKTAYKKSKLFQGTSKGVQERKYLDTIINTVVGNAAGGILLNGLAEGSDNVNRIGRKVTMVSINVDGMFAANPIELGVAVSYPEMSDTIRISIVYDKQPNGAAATSADVWSGSGPYSKRNMDNIERFDVLMEDRPMICQAGPNAVSHNRYLKVSLPVRYTGTAGAAANITTGSLLMFLVDTNSSGVQQGTYNGVVRVLFTDD